MYLVGLCSGDQVCLFPGMPVGAGLGLTLGVPVGAGLGLPLGAPVGAGLGLPLGVPVGSSSRLGYFLYAFGVWSIVQCCRIHSGLFGWVVGWLTLKRWVCVYFAGSSVQFCHLVELGMVVSHYSGEPLLHFLCSRSQ
jgi:hypothetical protein